MRGHNICFNGEGWIVFLSYPRYSFLFGALYTVLYFFDYTKDFLHPKQSKKSRSVSKRDLDCLGLLWKGKKTNLIAELHKTDFDIWGLFRHRKT